MENPSFTGSTSGCSGPEKSYLDALEKGVWKIQSCISCERAIFYPRNVCPHCGCDDLVWFEPSGKGTVYASSTIHRSKEGGGNYNVSLIDLAEGVRLMSTVQGCVSEHVQIGMPVVARVDRSGPSARLVFDAVRTCA